MLVLSRRLNEAIVIGDDVEITIVEVRSKNIRLGIVAPPGITVHRKEIWKCIHDQTRTEGRQPDSPPPTADHVHVESAVAQQAVDGSYAAEIP